MYVRYTYNATTQLALMNDLVTLLTSATAPTLSALPTCISASSVINTSLTLGGWTLHDTPDANSVVLKAPVFDNVNNFKYLYINAATAGYLVTHLFDTWDAVAHTGTYPAIAGGVSAAVSNLNGIPIVLSAQSTLYIYASPRAVIIYSLIGTTWTGPYGCSERSRIGAWDTVTNAFNNTIQWVNCTVNSGYPTNRIYAPYVINAATAGQPKVASFVLGFTTIWGYFYNAGVSSGSGSYYCPYIDARGYAGANIGHLPPANTSSSNALLGSCYALTRLNVSSIYNYSNEGGSLSDASGIYVLPLNVGNPEDTVSAEGNMFILMGTAYARLVVPMG